MDWHQAHWLELARQSSQVRRLGGKQGQVTVAHTPMHPPSLPDLAGLTGCRVGGTPLGSSGHLGPGLAGCMLHPLCGWCSDATHKRGPGVAGTRSKLSPHLPKTHCHSLLPLAPCNHLQPQPCVCLPSSHSSLDNSCSVTSGGQVGGGEKGKWGIHFPNLHH